MKFRYNKLMKPIFLRFVLSLSVFSLVIILAGLVIFNYLLTENTLTTFSFVFACLLFHVVILIVHYVLLKSSEQRAQNFVRNFIATTFLKLLTYLLILVIFIVLNRENVKAFIITFLILYLSYTVFETIAIIKFFKKRS